MIWRVLARRRTIRTLTHGLGLLRSPERVYCFLEGYCAEMLQPLGVPRTFDASLGYAVQLLHNDG